MNNVQETFCLLKSETYIVGKKTFIEQRIQDSGLVIVERWKVRLTFVDIFRLYDGWIARIVTIMRFPPLFKLDMYILRGCDAINRMHTLKYEIRSDIWAWGYSNGGFLHAPDTKAEASRHKAIIAKRRIAVFPSWAES